MAPCYFSLVAQVRGDRELLFYDHITNIQPSFWLKIISVANVPSPSEFTPPLHKNWSRRTCKIMLALKCDSPGRPYLLVSGASPVCR